jgi:isoleucyl-tRNA synthetase
MAKYNDDLKQLNLPEIDRIIRQFWEENDIFNKSVKQKSVDNSFVFYEGPPSANGKPGIHHVMGRAVKDLFCRYQTMKGKRVERKGGWDTHGLPIELSVEKELGITKEDIGTKISVDDYNAKCRETVMQYKDQWDDITRRMGYWVDLDQSLHHLRIMNISSLFGGFWVSCIKKIYCTKVTPSNHILLLLVQD